MASRVRGTTTALSLATFGSSPSRCSGCGAVAMTAAHARWVRCDLHRTPLRPNRRTAMQPVPWAQLFVLRVQRLYLPLVWRPDDRAPPLRVHEGMQVTLSNGPTRTPTLKTGACVFVGPLLRLSQANAVASLAGASRLHPEMPSASRSRTSAGLVPQLFPFLCGWPETASQ